MGNGVCTTKPVVREFSPDVIGTGSFHSTLAALPKLFTDVVVNGHLYLVTCHPSQDLKNVIVATTDTKRKLYKRLISQEELRKQVS